MIVFLFVVEPVEEMMSIGTEKIVSTTVEMLDVIREQQSQGFALWKVEKGNINPLTGELHSKLFFRPLAEQWEDLGVSPTRHKEARTEEFTYT